eukprot:TRINITY_DN629_c0_g1_i2.p2 TRINITY_DN629_c0_g1~~TRINITY_DN629_c0_g1_i2.p2  ORF type:complete len:387 (-),score=43.16 TRINITY_DN629_c0_g1_i2:1596-2756(-)
MELQQNYQPAIMRPVYKEPESKLLPPPPRQSRTTDGGISFSHLITIADSFVPQESMPCKNKFNRRTMKFDNTCTYGKSCRFAHSWSQLKETSAATTLISEVEFKNRIDANIEIRFWDCDNEHDSPRLMAPLTQFYNTKLSKDLVNRINKGTLNNNQVEDLVSGNLCYEHTYYSKCTRMQNCNFLHIDKSTFDFKRYLCPKVDTKKGIKCHYSSSCIYAHDVFSFHVPRDVFAPIITKTGEINEIMFFVDKLGDYVLVPTQYVIQQEISSFTQDNYLCLDDFCPSMDSIHYYDDDMTAYHLHSSYWVDFPDTIIPMPTSYTKHVVTKSKVAKSPNTAKGPESVKSYLNTVITTPQTNKRQSSTTTTTTTTTAPEPMKKSNISSSVSN